MKKLTGNEIIRTYIEFFKEKGFENDPVRCPACRKARKQQRNAFRKEYQD